MSGVDAPAPWRIAFDNARDPYTARNALGAEKIGGGGSAGAPANAEYIVSATDPTLTAERVLTDTATIVWDFTTPGQAKASTAAGGGNVSNSGTPTLGQYAKWVTSTTIQGVNASVVLGDIGAQPLDGDLTAIAALTGTNTIYYRSAIDTWSAVTVSTGLSFVGGVLTATGGGGGTPGGSNTQVQFNDSGAFGGDADLTWNKSSVPNLLTVNGNISVLGASGNSLQAAGAIQASLFRCVGTIALYGTELTSGVVNIRPNSITNATGQFQVQSSGTVVVNGNIELGATDTTLARVSAGVVAIEGQNILTAATGQPLDGDLTAIAALTGTNTIYYRSGTSAWSAVTVGTGLTFTSGTLDRAALTGDVTASAGSNATTIANDAVTYAKMQNVSAASVLIGRGSAAGAGDPQEITLGTNLSMSGTTLNASGGGSVTDPTPPQGRLTLQTATPVMITTQSAKTTIFYTPYSGNKIGLYDGTNFVMTTFAEMSTTTTDTTKNPAAIGANKVNDWFVWNDAGTIRLSHGTDWTSDTSRGASTGLNFINGVWVNFNNITNGPNATRGTYVGTTRSNASSQLDWIYGAIASGGTAAFFGVWNAYNRVNVTTMVGDSTTTWTYAGGFVRAANNSTNMRVSAVIGLSEDAVSASYSANVFTSPAAQNTAVGVAYNAVSLMTGAFAISQSAAWQQLTGRFDNLPFGFNFWQAAEYTSSSSTTFAGQNANLWQNGLFFNARM